MLIAFQFPFADARPFLNEETHRLAAPDWPDAEAGQEFVRSIGSVRPRLRGGERIWAGEGVYCDAARLLRFPPRLSSRQLAPSTGGSVLACQFRRLFSDGAAVVRVELGLTRRAHPATTQGTRLPPLDSDGCLQFLLGCAATPVIVPSGNHAPASLPLLQADQGLRRQLLRSSTAREKEKPPFQPPVWWLTPGRPLILVQYWPREVVSLPSLTRRVETDNVAPLDLSHMGLLSQNRLVTVWFLGLRPDADRDVLRRLRIHLFRLHAERECLRHVLKHIKADRITVERGSEASERLQHYLDRTFNLFFSQTRYGINQSKILEAAYRYDDLVSEADQATLLQRLTEIRGTISRKVAKGTTPQPIGEETRSIYIEQYIEKAIIAGEGNIVDKSIRIGDVGGSITGIVGIDSSITSSFNRVQESQAPDELKTKLTELTAAVAEMAKHLPEEQAKVAARDLDTFTQEATSEAPRRNILEAIGNGLAKTADVVDKVGAPVVALVKAILLLI
jgi:hypothetical protein